MEKFAQDGLDEAHVVSDEDGIVVDEEVDNSPEGFAPNKEKEAEEPKPENKEAPDAEVKAALEAAEQADPEEEPESTIAQILPKPEAKPESQDQKVPLADHIKLRQRAQKAERELEELRQRPQTTPTGAEKPGEQSPFEQWVEENPEDAEISDAPAKVKLAERKYQEARAREAANKQAEAERLAREQAQAEQAQLSQYQALEQKATTSEKQFRKEHPDYDKVTKAVLKLNLLTDAERRALAQSEELVKDYYELCKDKLAAVRDGLGITPTEEPPKQPANPEEEEEREMSDDEVFEEIFKK